MIIESGLIVALGLILTFFKCPWRLRMKMLSHPLAMDLIIFTVLNVLHWGTFSGLMVAATGALVCSGMITLGRCLFGYLEGRVYQPGLFNIVEKIR